MFTVNNEIINCFKKSTHTRHENGTGMTAALSAAILCRSVITSGSVSKMSAAHTSSIDYSTVSLDQHVAALASANLVYVRKL